jgi:ornithine cyclodeaminase
MAHPAPIILSEEEVARFASMDLAIRAVEPVFRAQAAGKLVAPARHRASFQPNDALVFTIGGIADDSRLAGFRVYDTFAPDGDSHSQFVAVWRDGSLRGILLGHRVGELRTGAIGALAIRHMARPDGADVAVIGSGLQARTQLEGAAAVRSLRKVTVFSRSAEKRQTFAAEMSQKLGISIAVGASARDAVVGADIVLCATSSTVPVLLASWLKPGAHVNTLGPKLRGEQEIGLDVAERAAMIATDSLAQTRAYGAPFFLDGSPAIDRMVHLADIVAGKVAGRPAADALTLFCSVGLAGTEVALGAAILDAAGGTAR